MILFFPHDTICENTLICDTGKQKSMFTVKVPATSANMGPCFDSAGMAFSLYNEVSVTSGGECAFDEPFKIESRNEIDKSVEAGQTIPLDETNLIYKTIKWFSERKKRPLPRFMLRQTDRIPLARGLGSSAACIVSGLLIADRLCETELSRDELLHMAVKLEGHPDNVAPAFLGDMVVGALEGRRFEYLRVPLPRELEFIVLVPDFPLPTEKARRVLPPSYSREQAVYNTSRAALLVGSLLTGNYDKLSVAMRDRMHQPYRSRLIHGMDGIIDAAEHSGAFGGFLSGAGPSLVVVARRGEGVASELERYCETLGTNWRVFVMEPDRTGALII